MHQQQVAGGTSSVGGVVGVISLLIADEASSVNLWHETWFLWCFGGATALGLIGLYVVASAYIPLPLPPTLEQRRARTTPPASTARIGGPSRTRTIVRPGGAVVSGRKGAAPAIPDNPVRMELTAEAQKAVAADLAEPPYRHPPVDSAALARELRTHYGRGRPILTGAESAPNKSAIYDINRQFGEWGSAIEESLTRRLFPRMAEFVLSLERPDTTQPFLVALLRATSEAGPGGHDGLYGQVRERLDRLQALIQALEVQP